MDVSPTSEHLDVKWDMSSRVYMCNTVSLVVL